MQHRLITTGIIFPSDVLYILKARGKRLFPKTRANCMILLLIYLVKGFVLILSLPLRSKSRRLLYNAVNLKKRGKKKKKRRKEILNVLNTSSVTFTFRGKDSGKDSTTKFFFSFFSPLKRRKKRKKRRRSQGEKKFFFKI